MEWITTFLQSALSYLDGNLVDIGSLIFAFGYVVRQRNKVHCDHRCDFWSRQTGKALVNAISIFPLGLLALSIVSSKLTELLLSSSKLTLTIAGGYALFTMLEDQGAKNAALVTKGAPEFMGPPAPKLAPQQQLAQQPSKPALQRGKILSVLPISAVNETLTRAQRRRRAQAAKKLAAQQSVDL